MAQDVRPFTVRYTTDARGKMVMVANNIITTKQKPGGGAPNYTTAPPGCPSGSALCKNDAQYNTNIDIDGDNNTINSSSAKLDMPTCNAVAYAALYWGAGIAINQGNNGALPMRSSNWNKVKFKVPNSSTYQLITADKTDTLLSVFHGYQCFRDVTDLVRDAGKGFYTVADVKCDTVNAGNQPLANAFGGWTLIVIYADPSQPLKNFTIFDGLTVISNTVANSSRDITITGFKCPPAGNVVATMGTVVYDGDRGEADGFFIKQNGNGVFYNQTIAGESAVGTSGINDAWNSSITDRGSLVSSRVPAHQNTYGFDAHLYKLNNNGNRYLRNNDNSALVRISTSSEGYVLGLLTSEIDTYYPELILENSMTPTKGSSPVYVGDTILITSTVRNTGNNTATGVRAEDKLPDYFKFVPGSIKVDNVAKTDLTGDDVAEYVTATRTVVARLGSAGAVSVADPDYVLNYKVTIIKNCSEIGSSSVQLEQQTKLFYQDQASTVIDSTSSRPKSLDNCVAAVAAGAITVDGCLTVLAIRQLSFTGTRTPLGNQLQWKMQEENDAAKYTIQVAEDGLHYKDIYTKQASGSTGVFYYSYTDSRNYPTGSIYYRIKTGYINGKTIFSASIVLSNTAASAIVLQQASPAARTISIRSSEKISFVQWYNNKGQFLKSSQNIVASQPVDVSELAPGIYYLRVYTQQDVQVLKMLRQ
jgi:uncharacterized repeat protein (TIGR01451 family)